MNQGRSSFATNVGLCARVLGFAVLAVVLILCLAGGDCAPGTPQRVDVGIDTTRVGHPSVTVMPDTAHFVLDGKTHKLSWKVTTAGAKAIITFEGPTPLPAHEYISTYSPPFEAGDNLVVQAKSDTLKFKYKVRLVYGADTLTVDPWVIVEDMMMHQPVH